jgi:hypothetical protein
MSPLVALRVVLLLRIDMSAIGAGADMHQDVICGAIGPEGL